MTATEAFKSGDPGVLLESAKSAVRSDPSEPRHRILLFQAEALLGHWDKALAQLDTLSTLNAESDLLAKIFRPVIEAEAVRQEVFSGAKTPAIFGEPEPWMGKLAESLRLFATGEHAAAGELRAQAYDEAPATPGTLNGEAFEWVADSDSRLGPMLEVILDGRYLWAPFSRILSLRIPAPEDLRNLVWTPAELVWTNNGSARGFIPTRYIGTESSGDTAALFARRTDWREEAGGAFIGCGQRELATSAGQTAILETREITLAGSTEPAAELHV